MCVGGGWGGGGGLKLALQDPNFHPQLPYWYVYSNAKITHICSVRYFMSKLKYSYAGNDKIWNALLMH